MTSRTTSERHTCLVHSSTRVLKIGRKAKKAADRITWELAGNLPGFEEASRAFCANDTDAFARRAAGWLGDVRDHLVRLVEEAVRLEEQAAAASGGPVRSAQ